MRRMLSQTPGSTAFMASSEHPKVQIRTSVIQRFQQTLKKFHFLSPHTILFFFQLWKIKNIILNCNLRIIILILNHNLCCCPLICCFVLNSKHSFLSFFCFSASFWVPFFFLPLQVPRRFPLVFFLQTFFFSPKWHSNMVKNFLCLLFFSISVFA